MSCLRGNEYGVDVDIDLIEEAYFIVTSLMFNARVDLCGGTLRPARPNSSLLPSRQAVPEDRDMLPNVGVLGKLLLEERCKLFANE